jgi:hypothetical protein
VIKIGDKVELSKAPNKEVRAAMRPAAELGVKFVVKRGTVIPCVTCKGMKKKTCEDCLNSIAGRSYGGPPNWCFVLWDGTDWIQGVYLSDLRVISVVDQLAEL